ncbi:MAG: GFA family protein [Spongiibacteraceae bacterium]
MNKEKTNGSCLCGEVQYEISGNLGIFQYCHCSRCRKFSGSAFAANLMVKPDQFRWLAGESKVAKFLPPETKHFATAFCQQCGSSLPWHSKSGKAVIVPAGTLNGHPNIEPSNNIFCGSRAQWYKDPSELPDHDQLPRK